MKIELLMPAGNPEKLKFALLYGADAVYVGGKILSLRAQASNFTLEDIKEGVEFAHSLNKKVYITVNVIPRERELELIEPYLKSLEEIKVDGVIVSSPAILDVALKKTNLHVSLSTQASAMNLSSIEYYHSLGIERIVLAREVSLEEIKYIKSHTDAEIEVFIHGGMCSGVSGRCSLSNYMSLRDANSGGCAHSCRWTYDIYKGDQKLYDEEFKIGSKDLCSIPFIEELVNAKVESLKVEGRMKSISYIANVAYTYRRLIDDIYNGTKKDDEYYYSLLGDSVNREASTGFMTGDAKESETLYSKESSLATQGFYGIVLDYNSKRGEALVEVRNVFSKEEVEVLSPSLDVRSFRIEYIKDEKLNLIKSANHAMDKVIINTPYPLKKYDIIRRKV
ncbi:MAG: U32 family peptidase [Gammaproteobacteria bacterium]|nr:U32 family peptidase [Gammaproteobacteria bacterium]